MLPPDFPEPRQINGVTILGPDFFAEDGQKRPLSPIASVFPSYEALVTGRGIHAMQAMTMVDFLREQTARGEQRDMNAAEEQEVLRDAVSLLVRGGIVLIRSDPERMQHIFAADDVLLRVVPKDLVQFTGAHLLEVRQELRNRGECWRISPHPHSVEEICSYIRASRVQVGTGSHFYHNIPSGGRFLTYEEFMQIRPLLWSDRTEALARLNEIIDLTDLVNDQGARELGFFLPAGKSLDKAPLERLVDMLRSEDAGDRIDEMERLFDEFAAAYAREAGLELVTDDENNLTWRTTMFCRLTDINELEVEEWALGLSPEFYLNILWLPGARIVGGELRFEEKTEPRVRSLIEYYVKEREGLTSINVGRVESSQTVRDRTGEQRAVFLVVLGLADGGEEIRIVRMIKWDILHRINRGVSLNQAIAETLQYREYIFDRLRAAEAMGLPVPSFSAIELTEHVRGLGWVPTIFFDRPYVPGMVTDKIPGNCYARPEFVIRLARLLGEAAAFTLALGRASPQSGHVFFDDGDEVIQLDADALPRRVLLADTTGSFTDWITPMEEMLPHCLWHVGRHLERGREKGVSAAHLAKAVGAFTEGLRAEVTRLQATLRERADTVRSLFAGRSNEPGGIRCRAEGVAERLRHTPVEDLLRVVAESEHLAPFRQGG
jgi:PAS domain-containing protein